MKPIYFQCEVCKGTKKVPKKDYIGACGYNNCSGVFHKKDMFQKKGFWHWYYYGFVCPVCNKRRYRERLINWPMIPCPNCQDISKHLEQGNSQCDNGP